MDRPGCAEDFERREGEAVGFVFDEDGACLEIFG